MKRGQLFEYLKRIFLSYFLAIGIPVCVLAGIYLSIAVKENREEEASQTRRAVQTMETQLEGLIERAYDYVSITAAGSDLRAVRKESYANSVYSYGQLLSSMDSFTVNNNEVEVSLYIQNSNKVLSTDDGIEDFSSAKERDVLSQFLKDENRGGLYRDGDKIVLLTVLPLYYYTDSVVFLFYIDPAVYAQTVEAPCSIVGADGTVLFDQGIDPQLGLYLSGLEGNGGYFSELGQEGWYARESQSGACFVSLYNQAELRTTIIRTVFITLAVLLSSLLVICAIAYGMMRHYTSPVKKLALRIRQMPRDSREMSGGKTGIFDSIQSFVDDLYNQNQQYRTSVEQNSGIVRDHALRDLVWCRLPMNCSAQEYLKKEGFGHVKPLFVPVLIKTSAVSEDQDVWKRAELSALLRNVLTENLEELGMFLGATLLETDQILVLLHGEQEEWDRVDLAQEMKSQVDLLGKQFDIPLQVITGFPVASPEELCRQFTAMRRKLYLTPEHKRDVSAVTVDTEEAELPIWLRTSLLNAVRSGDEFQVRELFMRLQTLLEKLHDPDRQNSYLLSLAGSVLSHLMDSPVEISADKLNLTDIFSSAVPNDQRLGMLQDHMLTLCACFQKNTRQTENVHVQKAMKFIHDNLGKEISLSDIADNVGINTSYLIRMFKAELEVTPLQYLTALRMERAKELLLDPKLTVKQISDQLGYSDMRSFVRFFKKAEGCTPNEYREKIHF